MEEVEAEAVVKLDVQARINNFNIVIRFKNLKIKNFLRKIRINQFISSLSLVNHVVFLFINKQTPCIIIQFISSARVAHISRHGKMEKENQRNFVAFSTGGRARIKLFLEEFRRKQELKRRINKKRNQPLSPIEEEPSLL